MCLLTYVIGEREHARSTYKKNILELVVGVFREKTSWRMLKVRTKERSLLVVFFFDYIIYGDSNRDLFVLFLRAIIRVLIFNYTSLKRGLIVKRAWYTCDPPEFLHNLVCFKLF